jgi:hypothetical protein
MANNPTVVDFTIPFATFLTLPVSDGTWNDVLITKKLDEAGKEATATQQDQAAGQLWSNLGDDFIRAAWDKIRLPFVYIAGLGMLNEAGDLDHDIQVNGGECRSDDAIDDMLLTTAIIKQIDAAWVVGTNQGGLDTGVVAIDSWYHLWLIKRDDTQVVDVLFSLSATAPTLPANYTRKRRLGAVLTDGSANILAFLQQGDLFLWSTTKQDHAPANVGTTAGLFTVSTPLGVLTEALLRVSVERTGSDFGVLISSPFGSDDDPVTPALRSHSGHTNGSSVINSAPVEIFTSFSSQVRARSEFMNTDVYIGTYGWIDKRGKL